MRIDRRLNLVIPIEREEGDILFAHSAPVSAEVLEKYYRPIALTYARLVDDGLIRAGGALSAFFALREISQGLGLWEDDPRESRIGVERGLVGEIRRLTNVFAHTEKGWDMVMLEDCIRDGAEILTKDEIREVQAVACFFTCISHHFPKQNVKELVDRALQLGGAATTYLGCTDFRSSLPTSTAGENFGVTVVGWWDTFLNGAPPKASAQ